MKNTLVKKQIEDLLMKNLIEDSIDQLNIILIQYLDQNSDDSYASEQQNDLILKSAHYHSTSRKRLLNLISDPEFDTEEKKVRADIVRIMKNIFNHKNINDFIQKNNIIESIKNIEHQNAKEERKRFIKRNILLILSFSIGALLAGTYFFIHGNKRVSNSYQSSAVFIRANSSNLVKYSKTFVFWIPEFANARLVGNMTPDEIESDFNKYLLGRFNGLSRWPVNGYYLSSIGEVLEENGWFYQISIDPNLENTSITDVEQILSRYFMQQSWYIIETNHQKPK